MFKSLSILLVIFVAVIGITFGSVSTASASASLPAYNSPVNVVPHNVPAPEKIYVVKKGDSLSEIAVKFGFKSWEKLYCKNRKVIGSQPSLILPKMRLTIKEARNLCKVPVLQSIPAKTQIVVSSSPVVNSNVNSGTYAGSSSFQSCVIAAESGGNPQVMNSSGHYGLYQFAYSTWVAYGGNPSDFGNASVAEQNQVFYNAMATAGGASNWAPYDGC